MFEVFPSAARLPALFRTLEPVPQNRGGFDLFGINVQCVCIVVAMQKTGFTAPATKGNECCMLPSACAKTMNPSSTG